VNTVPIDQFILRLLLSAVLGGVIGFERERQSQPAGLRTLIILSVGSTLAMVLSINMAFQYTPGEPAGDPARLAAQVVSGIGFLGAGAILHYGINVKGLTTATSLWTIAIVGLAVGAGRYIESIATTLVMLLVLVGLNIIERRYIHSYTSFDLTIKAADKHGMIEEIKSKLSDPGHTVKVIRVSKDLDDNRITVELTVRALETNLQDHLIGQLSGIEGVKSFKIE
jgi:putative Mg2+ transporter-C (MgtC) family protein